MHSLRAIIHKKGFFLIGMMFYVRYSLICQKRSQIMRIPGQVAQSFELIKLHTNFGLSSGGEDLRLLAPDGSTLVSQLFFSEQIADIVLQEFSVSWLRLRLGKPGAVPKAKDVGVIIERGERS